MRELELGESVVAFMDKLELTEAEEEAVNAILPWVQKHYSLLYLFCCCGSSTSPYTDLMSGRKQCSKSDLLRAEGSFLAQDWTCLGSKRLRMGNHLSDTHRPMTFPSLAVDERHTRKVVDMPMLYDGRQSICTLGRGYCKVVIRLLALRLARLIAPTVST